MFVDVMSIVFLLIYTAAGYYLLRAGVAIDPRGHLCTFGRAVGRLPFVIILAILFIAVGTLLFFSFSNMPPFPLVYFPGLLIHAAIMSFVLISMVFCVFVCCLNVTCSKWLVGRGLRVILHISAAMVLSYIPFFFEAMREGMAGWRLLLEVDRVFNSLVLQYIDMTVCGVAWVGYSKAQFDATLALYIYTIMIAGLTNWSCRPGNMLSVGR